MSAADVRSALARYELAGSGDEAALQDAIAVILTAAGIAHEREVQLGAEGRVDFLTAAGVAIELKVQGSASTVLRQLDRYAHAEGVAELVLVTTRAQHLSLRGASLRVPLHVHHLSGL